MATRYYMRYTLEHGRPDPTPTVIFRLLGVTPTDRPDLWELLQHLAEQDGGWMIVARPTDLGMTPIEVALVLRLCAAHRLSVHIVDPGIQIIAAAPRAGEPVHRTTAEFAALATALLRSPRHTER